MWLKRLNKTHSLTLESDIWILDDQTIKSLVLNISGNQMSGNRIPTVCGTTWHGIFYFQGEIKIGSQYQAIVPQTLSDKRKDERGPGLKDESGIVFQDLEERLWVPSKKLAASDTNNGHSTKVSLSFSTLINILFFLWHQVAFILSIHITMFVHWYKQLHFYTHVYYISF